MEQTPPTQKLTGGEPDSNATPTDATPTDAMPTDAPPTGATPTEPPPTDATPTEPPLANATPTEPSPANATPSSEGAQTKGSPKAEKGSGTKQPEAKKPKKPTVKYVNLPVEDQTTSMAKVVITQAREKEVCVCVCVCVCVTRIAVLAKHAQFCVKILGEIVLASLHTVVAYSDDGWYFNVGAVAFTSPSLPPSLPLLPPPSLPSLPPSLPPFR